MKNFGTWQAVRWPTDRLPLVSARMEFGCWKCRKRIGLPAGGRVLARDTCPTCDADLHACRNCKHYDPAKHNQCAETRAEWVRDKEASNYCDYFSPSPILLAGKLFSPVTDAKKEFNPLLKS